MSIRLIAGLGLPYRIIEICTGDMGQSHHRSFDIEVYAPGCDNWLEVSSVSWFSDYQARRADIRFKRTGQKGTEVANTLNGSALAVPRVWEKFQAALQVALGAADGRVARLPEQDRHGQQRAPKIIAPKVISWRLVRWGPAKRARRPAPPRPGEETGGVGALKPSSGMRSSCRNRRAYNSRTGEQGAPARWVYPVLINLCPVPGRFSRPASRSLRCPTTSRVLSVLRPAPSTRA